MSSSMYPICTSLKFLAIILFLSLINTNFI
nr:MAG TPA: hypothetical protein [Caudoviricetes sp.]